jgi:translation initiation factor IF-3|tara:strand:+ start:666 stop:1334 length:669 start_codon:yes stop_codon:yes gene_type:complete
LDELAVRVLVPCNEDIGAIKRTRSSSFNLVNVETPIKKTSKRIDRSLLNDDIEATSVRLVAADGSQRGVVPRAEALAEARQAGLDLVLVVADANPPVCKVMDYGKHLFELKKTKAAQRKKQKQIQVKEMKFRPGTEEGDYQVKLRNLRRFLEDGDKTKVSLRFRGREVVHPEIGMNLMTRIAADLDDLGSVESEPKFEGRQVIMVLAPRKNKKAPSLKPDAE